MHTYVACDANVANWLLKWVSILIYILNMKKKYKSSRATHSLYFIAITKYPKPAEVKPTA